ncbi:hypothetical protein PR202_gb13364 [Eleusine coracana subsp. coracana]|uniref:Uncharacterized protein n=1 Tax=Eleusine coracana subsp. coracana TaxID=191504 RepID=A0AAV5ETI6_ELECO|nr:hypothetical protein PR202_gb13364 [Eleusine coracana subsp. coracana]
MLRHAASRSSATCTYPPVNGHIIKTTIRLARLHLTGNEICSHKGKPKDAREGIEDVDGAGEKGTEGTTARVTGTLDVGRARPGRTIVFFLIAKR